MSLVHFALDGTVLHGSAVPSGKEVNNFKFLATAEMIRIRIWCQNRAF